MKHLGHRQRKAFKMASFPASRTAEGGRPGGILIGSYQSWQLRVVYRKHTPILVQPIKRSKKQQKREDSKDEITEKFCILAVWFID